jgi:hypothetical protein
MFYSKKCGAIKSVKIEKHRKKKAAFAKANYALVEFAHKDSVEVNYNFTVTMSGKMAMSLYQSISHTRAVVQYKLFIITIAITIITTIITISMHIINISNDYCYPDGCYCYNIIRCSWRLTWWGRERLILERATSQSSPELVWRPTLLLKQLPSLLRNPLDSTHGRTQQDIKNCFWNIFPVWMYAWCKH